MSDAAAAFGGSLGRADRAAHDAYGLELVEEEISR